MSWTTKYGRFGFSLHNAKMRIPECYQSHGSCQHGKIIAVTKYVQSSFIYFSSAEDTVPKTFLKSLTSI